MCYHNKEVNSMEQENFDNIPLEETPEVPRYQPRPKWQVWLARIVLVVFLALLAMYYVNIYRGGR